jgi:ectoine hydroxylase-related dioxygenase (phytanoyl-CoA dioxygenase family)
MNLPGALATGTLRFDGRDVTIDRTFDERADVTLECDYQAALSLAQFVGVLVPGGTEAMWREARHMFGAQAFRLRGELAGEGVKTLVGLFHDHMARRTVENPDLEHRARKLGLIGNIREMEEQGFTVVQRAITDGFADEMRAAIKGAVLPQQGVSMNWMLYQGRPFERIVLNPMAMTLIDASLGRGAQLASNAAIVRGPGKGLIDIHTDYTDVPEPYPEFAMSGVSVWAFEDWTEASGPTWIVPGSHRRRRAPRQGEGLDEGVPTEMPKGSVVFFTQGVWHWQGHRSDPGERVTLHPHFNRGILRSVEQKRPDVQMLARNPPRLGEMLGEDDWFDKMTPTGRDYTRLEHMRQLHAFTNHKMKAIRAPAEAAA